MPRHSNTPYARQQSRRDLSRANTSTSFSSLLSATPGDPGVTSNSDAFLSFKWLVLGVLISVSCVLIFNTIADLISPLEHDRRAWSLITRVEPEVLKWLEENELDQYEKEFQNAGKKLSYKCYKKNGKQRFSIFHIAIALRF